MLDTMTADNRETVRKEMKKMGKMNSVININNVQLN